MNFAKYSLGTGDRFGLQGKAQLAAIRKAAAHGVELAIVWNKSHREHTIVKTSQQQVRKEADQAVQAAGWKGQYLVDADHIGLGNVDLFMDSSDFFTLDVADYIDKKADETLLKRYVEKHAHFVGELIVPGIGTPLSIDANLLEGIAAKYLHAVQEAGKIYRYIKAAKKNGDFITEVSMDETPDPQTPLELLFILAALADEGIPVQTIAPKFSGRFNKGVDYRGDVEQFSNEFEDDLCVLKFAVKTFGLPADLKLSVHSGSDKFSIYGPIRELTRKHDAGIHVKTAGTTWLEELIGLAESGGKGLEIVKEIYARSFERYDELCAPYVSVIDINFDELPRPERLNGWSSREFVRALRHDQSCPDYNVNLRQLLHVGFKVAAEMGETYLKALVDNETVVSKNVTENLYERHIKPLFF